MPDRRSREAGVSARPSVSGRAPFAEAERIMLQPSESRTDGLSPDSLRRSTPESPPFFNRESLGRFASTGPLARKGKVQ
jgi:hypothetical protein